MTSRGRKYLILPLLGLAAIALSGCITPEADSTTGRYTAPIGGSPVIANETPYSDALRCMAAYTHARPLRIAVGQIADYTGKVSADNSGREITQGAALMAMSALAKAGVPLVERFDTSVAEMELKYANNKLIAGDQSQPQDGQGGDYRRIFAGSIPGSDYYLVGGITELNFNIRSEGANADASSGVSTKGGTLGGNMYVMNVGLDLRLVDTSTLEVVDVISYQKQIIGRQLQAGMFDFLGHTFFDASVGESALEPVQLAVRSVIERAVLEMTSRLYKVPQSACTETLGSSNDPLAGPDDDYHSPMTTANVASYKESYPYEAPRQDPYRGYSGADADTQLSLRGNEQ
ncbi:MAG TPA: holdfast anchoring protein HfaB [Rhizomicrobium sp.]|jgi:curli production assembly/transport component CsgG/holdfast attachment protein HfaB|nr:holdfast anchoring protein HfaB [Rhizomicrobium sp.]